MKYAKVLVLAALLLLPVSAALAQTPSISPISDLTVNAGGTTTINVVAVAPSNGAITLTSSLPSFVTLNTPTTGNGMVVTTLTISPTTAQVGTYTGTITLSAGGMTDVETFQVTVNAAGSNLAPRVVAPPIETIAVGSTLSFNVSATDSEAITSLMATDLPPGATFTPNGTYTSGTFTWAPNASQVGAYDVTFTAGNTSTGSATTHIVVVPSAANAITITPIGNVTVSECGTTTVNVNATGPTTGTLTLTGASMPSFITLNSPTTSTGTGTLSTTLTVSPTSAKAGTYPVVLTLTNGTDTFTTSFLVTVTAASTLNVPTVRTVTAGQTLTFTVSGTSQSGGNLTLTATGLPSGATFTDQNNNTGTFTFTPTASQVGAYTVTFSAQNGQGCTSTMTTVVIVLPAAAGGLVINPITNVTVPECGTASVNVNATGPTSGTLTLTAAGLPSFIILNNPTTSSGTGTLSTTLTVSPTSGKAGTYPITLTLSDGTNTTTQTFLVTVTSAATVNAPTTRLVDEGQALTFNVNATSTSGGTFTLTANNLPSGATFTDQGNNSGTFTWTPSSTQSGTYAITFVAHTPQGCTATATTIVTVRNVPTTGGPHAIATMIGRFNIHRKFTCFRIQPSDNSFNVTDVNLTSIQLSFNGTTLTALPGKTHLDFECDREDSLRLENCDCDNDDGECGDHESGDDEDCAPTQLHACFQTTAILGMLGNQDINTRIVDFTLTGTLSDGTTFTATFEPSRFADKGSNGDNGQGKKKGLDGRVRPNPLNPKGELLFTLSQPGRVRVTVYDLQGRLVKRLLDENLAAGPQSVTWDGTTARNGHVPSGVYYFMIEAPEGKAYQRVTVLK